MAVFKIMLDDLKPEIREEYLTMCGVKEPRDVNWDGIPVAVIPLPDLCEKDMNSGRIYFK